MWWASRTTQRRYHCEKSSSKPTKRGRHWPSETNRSPQPGKNCRPENRTNHLRPLPVNDLSLGVDDTRSRIISAAVFPWWATTKNLALACPAPITTDRRRFLPIVSRIRSTTTTSKTNLTRLVPSKLPHSGRTSKELADSASNSLLKRSLPSCQITAHELSRSSFEVQSSKWLRLLRMTPPPYPSAGGELYISVVTFQLRARNCDPPKSIQSEKCPPTVVHHRLRFKT